MGGDDDLGSGGKRRGEMDCIERADVLLDRFGVDQDSLGEVDQSDMTFSRRR